MKSESGFSLVEMLVAAACTGLLAAAVLTLLAGGAALGRTSMAEIEAQALAQAAVDALAVDLEQAGRGLEGAGECISDGSTVPVVQPLGAAAVRILLALADAIEVEPIEGPGRYRLSSTSGIDSDVLVAGLGTPGTEPVALLGRVRSVTRPRRGSRARMGVGEIAWAASEARLIQARGPVRALLPVTLRELGTVRREGAVQLRRRNQGGRWQPIVDGLEWVRIQYLVDEDGDGMPDGPTRELALAGAAGTIVGAHVAAAARAGEARLQVAERWVRIGR